jgi:hypothetical protein
MNNQIAAPYWGGFAITVCIRKICTCANRGDLTLSAAALQIAMKQHSILLLVEIKELAVGT